MRVSDRDTNTAEIEWPPRPHGNGPEGVQSAKLTPFIKAWNPSAVDGPGRVQVPW